MKTNQIEKARKNLLYKRPCVYIGIGVLTTILGCDGLLCSNGIVKDKLTNIPLDSVLCKVTSSNFNSAITDSNGVYSVCNDMGSCIGKCKDIQIEFSKTGYKTIVETNPGNDAVIYLEK